MMKNIHGLNLFIILIFLTVVLPASYAQTIPDQKVVAIKELPNYLKAEKQKELAINGDITTVILGLRTEAFGKAT